MKRRTRAKSEVRVLVRAELWLAVLVVMALAAVAVRRPDRVRWIGRRFVSVVMAKERAQEKITPGGVTKIEIGDRVVVSGVRRMGINLGEQEFFGSGQMLKNLVSRNPGFEGETWQSVLHCKQAAVGSCVDGMQSAVWPDGFWTGASYEVVDGAAEGRTGHVTASRKADGRVGAALSLDGGVGLHAGDYIIVRKEIPGDAAAGWWVENNGGHVATETRDLSPRTAGRQALRMVAGGAGQSVAVASYFDSTEGRSFIRVGGKYRLTFRAKLVGGNSQLHISFSRLTNPETRFFTNDVGLGDAWRDYSYEFDARDAVGTTGAVRLRFGVSGSTVLLDDVSLTKADGDTGNTTAFRDEVVNALSAYRPGVLRYMADATGLGATVANLEAGEFAHERAGYSVWKSEQEDVPYGLTEFLELCAKVHAEPWITLPAGSSATEAAQMVGWLHDRGWTQRFLRVHVELGNETWNSIFYGETFDNPAVYGHRASVIFGAMRRARGFDGAKFDLIAGGFIDLPDRNAEVVRAAMGADTLAVAPYLMHKVEDDGSDAALFGPLFAEPLQMDEAGGLMQKNRAVAGGKHLAVYEVNLHTTEGAISQAGLDRLTPSLGAGLAVAEHMLLMLRDDGVTTQAMYALPGYEFKRGDGKLVKLWGTVVDMGATNRRRPQFLALEMVNSVVLDEMVETRVSGSDVEGFAFVGGGRHGLVLMNLSLSENRAVELSGVGAPRGVVGMETLDGASVEAGNEVGNAVAIRAGRLDLGSGRVVLPAHSLVTLSW